MPDPSATSRGQDDFVLAKPERTGSCRVCVGDQPIAPGNVKRPSPMDLHDRGVGAVSEHGRARGRECIGASPEGPQLTAVIRFP